MPARDAFVPVRFKSGAIGNHTPFEVSLQHSMLLSGEPKVLTAARHLVNDITIRRSYPVKVTYLHTMFDDHLTIRAHGLWSESFHPNDQALRGVGIQSRHDCSTLKHHV